MVLDFLNSIYPFLFIPIGIVALLMGIDRALKSEEEESKKLEIIGGVSGLILLVLTVVLAINEFQGTEHIITKYSILFGILLGMSLIARPFKELPLAFVVAVIVTLGLLAVILYGKGKDISFFQIPLQYLLIGVLLIVILIFIISFIQEQAIDGLMFVLGWGPVITILGLSLIVQGITLLINYPNQDGILSYLPG